MRRPRQTLGQRQRQRLLRRPGAGRETVAAREAARAKTGYDGEAWTIPALDEALRAATPRTGLWLDTSGLTPARTVEAILAGRERARVL